MRREWNLINFREAAKHFLQQLRNFSIRARLSLVAVLAIAGLGTQLALHQYTKTVITHLINTQNTLAQLEIGMLTLRRSEKDSLARLDLKYQQRFNDNLSQTQQSSVNLSQSLASLELDQSKAQATHRILGQYGEPFNQVAGLYQKIGLDDNHSAI